MQVKKRKSVLIPQVQICQHNSNIELTLKAEQYFFSKIQQMDELLSGIMSCEVLIKKELWNEVFEFKKIS